MVCGPDRSFYAVNVNWPGSVHDARVLRNSRLAETFNAGYRPFPSAVILGDSAYSLSEWLITPCRTNPDNAVEQRFNRAHKRTRRIVENSFGILKEKFPCLNYLRMQPTVAEQIVIACCILHNLEVRRGTPIRELDNNDGEGNDNIEDIQIEEIERPNQNAYAK
ncbi:putative nuclease HARBI1 [Episyrphus balteatus]|uniref:putative nuclease HARBI1 n=1 Tax=Episyrphus balteatus TaxID=286459 RepID=UPI002486AA99|nr:putative nuclease HARBI1 [Episyrphus balteatus]